MSCLLQTKRISASTHRRVPLCKTAWRGDGHLTEMPLVPYVVPACVFGSSPAATTAYGNKRDGRPGGEDRRERERETGFKQVILHHQPAADYGCAQFKQRGPRIIHAVLWHMPKKPAGQRRGLRRILN